MCHEGDGTGRTGEYTDGKADERTGLRKKRSINMIVRKNRKIQYIKKCSAEYV